MYRLTDVQFLTLAVLARCPMHLYAMRQEIIELTDHTYYPTSSTLKKVANNLLGRDFIKECDSNPHYWLKARRGVPYELTEEGWRRLQREVAVYFRACQVIRGWCRRRQPDYGNNFGGLGRT